jgi:energy-converting hydrogenase Eha subunit H
MYVIFRIFLVVLALALYERLQAGASDLVRTVTAIGLTWAGAVMASGMVSNAGIGPVVALHAEDPAHAIGLTGH